MIDRNWYDDYLQRYRRALFESDVYESCLRFRDLAIQVRDNGGKLMFAGNGASAAIASHAASDFTKQGKVPSVTFHDPDFITMMANDYGYENWVAEAIASYHQPDDAVVLISSSGTSANIVNAAKRSSELRLPIVAASGFAHDNPLNQMASISFWLDSQAYNVIENTHSIWLTTVVDMLVGRAEYAVS